MFAWVDNGVLAGFSAALAYYYACGAALMCWLIWIYRGRFSYWFEIPLRDQADTIFNICFCILLACGGWSRANAAYGYADLKWPASQFNIESTLIHIPMMFTMLGIICWLCIVIFNKKYIFLWSSLVLVGIFLGAGVSWRF